MNKIKKSVFLALFLTSVTAQAFKELSPIEVERVRDKIIEKINESADRVLQIGINQDDVSFDKDSSVKDLCKTIEVILETQALLEKNQYYFSKQEFSVGISSLNSLQRGLREHLQAVYVSRRLRK